MQSSDVVSPRRQIAQMLSQHYAELANLGSKPTPNFSVARVFATLADGGLLDGYEKKICSAAAMAAGEHFEKNAPIIPWSALAQRDATVAGSGGYLHATDVGLAADVLRPYSVVVNAGAQVVENLVGNLVIPKATTATTGNWISDEAGTGAAEADPVLAQVALTPHTYIAYTNYSHLLAKQSTQAESFLRTLLLRAAGTALDKAVLAGAGTTEPLGLLSITGVGTQSGTSLAWAGVTNMLETVTTANATDANVVFVSTPTVRELLQYREVISTAADSFGTTTRSRTAPRW